MKRRNRHGLEMRCRRVLRERRAHWGVGFAVDAAAGHAAGAWAAAAPAATWQLKPTTMPPSFPGGSRREIARILFCTPSDFGTPQNPSHPVLALALNSISIRFDSCNCKARKKSPPRAEGTGERRSGKKKLLASKAGGTKPNQQIGRPKQPTGAHGP